MQLTEAQRLTLKSFIQNDGVLGPKATAGDYDFVANALNANFSPDFWVWRTVVSQLEAVTATTADGTVWSWPAYIARSQGERDGWREMFADGGSVNPTLDNVRQGFADIFSGASNSAPAQRTHLSTVGRRKATVAEKVLASGTGSTGSPAKLAVFNATVGTYCEGAIGAGDVGGIIA